MTTDELQRAITKLKRAERKFGSTKERKAKIRELEAELKKRGPK